jgi:ATP-dependent exoDNAse (exonuclease V) beta subunit
MFAITISEYQRTLAARALLDFSGVLEQAVDLLKQMDEFARSRYRLEARYHHVLVDEFQDTSRAQWELVEQLIRSWGEGLGVSADALRPSIFIVGDRKQSIYGFRDAEVALLDEAAHFVGGLRGREEARRAIAVSFRSVPTLLAFVNRCLRRRRSTPVADGSPFAFEHGDQDRFPWSTMTTGRRRRRRERPPTWLGLVGGGTTRAAADAVADEIVRLIGHAIIRTGRPASGGRRSRPTLPSCFDPGRATANSSRPSSVAPCRPTVQRVSVSSTRMRFRTRWPCSAISRNRPPIRGRPPTCGPG